MICPHCGSDVPVSKFCENCGGPLPVEVEPNAAVDNASAPIDGPVPMGVPVNAASEGYAPAPQPDFNPAPQPGFDPAQQQPGSERPQQVFGQQPYEASQQSYDAAQQPFETQQASYDPQAQTAAVPYGAQPAQQQQQAPSAAFVLVIIGLILSILGITFIAGLVCCIIGLVLNSKYNKQGMNNPRKTPTTVMGVIGIVISALMAVVFLLFGALIYEFYDLYVENGFDSDRIEVKVDDDGGKITITEKSEASPAASSSSASVATSSSEYFTAGDDIKFTLFLDNNGENIAKILGANGYKWSDTLDGFDSDRSDNVFWVCDTDYDDLTESKIKALPIGGKGEEVIFRYWTEGYTNADSALKAVAAGVTIENQKVSEDDANTIYAIVKNSAGDRFLVEAYYDGSDCNFSIYTAEALQEEAEATIDEAFAVL